MNDLCFCHKLCKFVELIKFLFIATSFSWSKISVTASLWPYNEFILHNTSSLTFISASVLADIFGLKEILIVQSS